MKRDFFYEKKELERDLWELEKRQSMRKKFETILKIYSLSGAVIAFFGIAYFILITLDIELTIRQQLALLVSGVGVALSITSWALLIMRRERMADEVKKLRTMQDISEFLWKWSKFESIAKEILLEAGREFNKYSIREVIEQLLIDELIDRPDALALEEAIQTRNNAVHGGNIIPKEILARYSTQIDDIVSKILKKKASNKKEVKMSSFDSCPYCGREAKGAISSNWFPVFTCLACGTKYCEECGPPCPDCDSSDYGEYDRVYA